MFRDEIRDLLAEPDGVVQVIVIQPLDPAGQDQVLGDGVNPAQEDVVEAHEPKVNIRYARVQVGVGREVAACWGADHAHAGLGALHAVAHLTILVAQLLELEERRREDDRILDGQSTHGGADHERLKLNAQEGEDRGAGDVQAADRERQDQIGLKLHVNEVDLGDRVSSCCG
jgi:hypothetical protein